MSVLSTWPLDYPRWNLLIIPCFLLMVPVHVIASQITLEFTLTEECPLHTYVGNLNGISLNSVTIPYPMSTFQLLTQTNLFVLNETTGELFTRGRIDRERLCPQQPQQSAPLESPSNADLNKLGYSALTPNDLGGAPTEALCRIQLQALQFTQKSPSDKESLSHRVILAKVIILDVNDNPPGWAESIIHLSVPEHSPIGTRLSLPAAFDPDCGPINTTMNYILRDLSIDDPILHGQAAPYGHEAFQLDTEFVPGSNPVELTHSNLPNLWLIGGCTRRMFKLWLRVVRDLEYDSSDIDNKLSLSPERQQQSLSHVDDAFSTNSLRLRNAHLQLVAVDGGQPTPLTGHVMINITVTDTNDNPPIFYSGSVTQPMKDLTSFNWENNAKQDQVEIEENTPVGRVVYVARAHDLDDIDNGRLTYKLDTSATLLARKMFEVNSKSGEVLLLQSPDFEQQRLYNVPISVTDGKHVTILNLIVRIKNQNDHPPVITIRPVGQIKDEHISKFGTFPHQFSASQSTSSQFPHAKSITLHVTENDPPGRFIATVTVTDVDDLPREDDGRDFVSVSSQPDYGSIGLTNVGDSVNKAVLCKLSHGGLELQPLFDGSPNQFKLVTRISFDREQQTEQFVTLTCYDRGHPPLSSQLGIHLIIEDVNDHGPNFKRVPMIAHLKENEPIGTKVFTVEAHDPDVGENAELGYFLDEFNSHDFTIDSRTGIISSLRSFDREQREYFNLSVTVRDQMSKHGGGNSPNTRRTNAGWMFKTDSVNEHKITGHVVVYIKDVNDCPPLFPNSLYQLSVSEDAKINFLVGQINASDADATESNNQIHYVIEQQPDNQAMQEFRVSPKGYIYVARGNLDREKVSSYNFHLIAIDSGVPPLSSTTQVHIYVTDVNDNAPMWQFPAHNNQAVNLTVSEPVGYRLAQLNAVDPDEGENGEVTYRLVQTNVIASRDDTERRKLFHSTEGSYIRAGSMNRQTAGNLFELDPSSGSIYVGRSMNLDDIGSVKLVVEARDQGKPPRVNHRVLQVNILRYMTTTGALKGTGAADSTTGGSEKGRHRSQNATGGVHIENDLIVIVIMVAITLIISLALIVAILFLRCGTCPGRNVMQYNPNVIPDYQHNASTTHHLEEVFRDSGTIDPEGLLTSGLDSMSNCNQLNDTTMTTYHTDGDTEPMFRSYLSTPGTNDPWLITGLTPKKAILQNCDAHNCAHGTITRLQSPCVRTEENNKFANTIASDRRTRRMDDRTLGSTSMAGSPEHEMHLLTTKRAIQPGKHPAAPCSTFRASCSHLTGVRSSTPGKATGKILMGFTKDTQIPSEVEDVESMDSGHGHSVDNGTNVAVDPLGQRPKSTNQLTTFRCQTPSSSSVSQEQRPQIRKFSTDLDNGDFDKLRRVTISRPRSGTLPSTFDLNDESLARPNNNHTTGEFVEMRMTSGNKSQTGQGLRPRQSVTWMDPTYQTCDPMDTRTGECEPGDDHQPHSTSCPHYVMNTELTRSRDHGTLVVLNSVDRLGYAQLVHSSTGLCDRNSPAQNAYSSFPTSFV